MIVEEIVALFDRHGDLHYGEDTTQRAHALQCAALAEAAGCAPTLIAAALLHDIGHFGEAEEGETPQTDLRHQETSARFLARAFPDAVTEPVRLHVAAKRYLCAVEPDYATQLSAASVQSLSLQGGAMSVAECAAFEVLPFASDAIRLRRFDGAGKVPGLVVPPFEHYRPMLEALAAGAAFP